MQQLIARSALLEQIRERLSESPVVALLGARQVGKTTLARMFAAEWTGSVTFFDLETAAAREALRHTPEQVLSGCRGLVVLDEVQRMPELFEILRPLCDRPDRPAVFLLLGSASPHLIRGASESLAGRIQFVEVPGFSLREVGFDAWERLWWRGGFPRGFLAGSEAAWFRWIEAFVRTFLERDIPALGTRVSSEALGRFWRMLAHYHGQIWNAAELARSMDVSPVAVNRYRDLLAGTFMVRILRPWFENIGKRQVKSPKVYIRDSGLLHYWLGLASFADLRAHPRYGASWEGFALEQVLAVHGSRESYFWATQRGAELDLLLIRGGKRWGFEFKCTDAPRLTKAMPIACDDLRLEHLFVVYPGSQRYALGNRVEALPLREIQDLAIPAW